jgi:hypothetical protein
MRRTRHVACWGDTKNAYTVLVKSQGKNPHGKSRHRWEDNIEINFREIWCECVDWFQETQVSAQ